MRREVKKSQSLPLRGEWIETGVRDAGKWRASGLSLYGESGLKLPLQLLSAVTLASLPLRGEWIETVLRGQPVVSGLSLSLYGESGLKRIYRLGGQTDPASLPLRGEWIETLPWKNGFQISA